MSFIYLVFHKGIFIPKKKRTKLIEIAITVYSIFKKSKIISTIRSMFFIRFFFHFRIFFSDFFFHFFLQQYVVVSFGTLVNVICTKKDFDFLFSYCCKKAWIIPSVHCSMIFFSFFSLNFH